MDKNKFNVVFPIITSALANRIAEELNLTEKEAITILYSSQLYEKLEHEETKVWQYSTEKLLELFIEERTIKKIMFSEV